MPGYMRTAYGLAQSSVDDILRTPPGTAAQKAETWSRQEFEEWLNTATQEVTKATSWQMRGPPDDSFSFVSLPGLLSTDTLGAWGCFLAIVLASKCNGVSHGHFQTSAFVDAVSGATDIM